MLGVGGGVVLVPALNLIGIPMHTVIGVSLSYIVFTAASGVTRHFRQGTVEPILALPIIAGSATTIQIGAYFCNLLSESTLQLLFGLLLVLVATSFIVKKSLPETEKESFSGGRSENNKFYVIRRKRKLGEKELHFKINLMAGVMIGGVVGFISGMFGVGGGFLATPLMVMGMHIPIHIAMGTDLLSVLLVSIIGSTTHWKLGNVDFWILLPIAITGIIGAQIGARLMFRFPQQKLRSIFNLMLITMSLYMLAKGIGYV